MKPEKVIIALSFLALIPILLPFLNGQILAGHDAGAHLTYLRIFTDALLQGQFPVRWIEWVHLGQNEPLFNFYQPLLYYIATIPHLLGLNILNSLYLTLVFLWILSGFLMFLFVKNITGNTFAGIASSIVYIYAPYHVLDVFVRASYPEISALAFVPGLFWSIERFFITKKTKYLVFLALFFAAVFISHPPTFLMFALPFVFYFCYLIFEDYKNSGIKNALDNSLKVFAGSILAFGIAAFFIIPAFIEQNLINSGSLANGYLDFRNHFACISQLFSLNWGFGISQLGCNDDLSFQVGIINWLVILASIFIIIYFWKKKIHHEKKNLLFIFTLFAFFGIYMMLSISQPFWEGIPYISFVQFPWRFLSVVIFSASVLSGLLFTYLKFNRLKLLLFIAIMILTPLLVFNYLKPVTYLSANFFAQDSNNFYKGVAQGQQGNAELGYMPIFAKALLPSQVIPPSEIIVSDSKTAIKVIKNNFDYKSYIIESNKPLKAEIFVHYFPGWKFYSNSTELKPDYSNPYGFVSLTIPAGQNTLVAKFENQPIVNISNFISLISIFIAILIMSGFVKLKFNSSS